MGKIVVVGHGYEVGQLTLEAVELFRSGAKVILHTQRCGCAQWLQKENIAFAALDALYESCEDFDEHAQAAAEAVCTTSPPRSRNLQSPTAENTVSWISPSATAPTAASMWSAS